MASFSISFRAFVALFFGAGAFLCFFALGGVLERSESSCRESRSGAESSSSVSGFGRFFDAAAFGLALSVVCDIFLVVALGAAAFFGAALGAAFDAVGALAFGLAFYGGTRQMAHQHTRQYP